MPLDVHSSAIDKLVQTKQFAQSRGLLPQLEAALERIGRNADAILYNDFAKYSFSFTVAKDGKFWYNGGLIYHGPSQEETFTVTLNDGEGWQIHT